MKTLIMAQSNGPMEEEGAKFFQIHTHAPFILIHTSFFFSVSSAELVFHGGDRESLDRGRA
jgi:hypothetical protein